MLSHHAYLWLYLGLFSVLKCVSEQQVGATDAKSHLIFNLVAEKDGGGAAESDGQDTAHTEATGGGHAEVWNEKGAGGGSLRNVSGLPPSTNHPLMCCNTAELPKSALRKPFMFSCKWTLILDFTHLKVTDISFSNKAYWWKEYAKFHLVFCLDSLISAYKQQSRKERISMLNREEVVTSRLEKTAILGSKKNCAPWTRPSKTKKIRWLFICRSICMTGCCCLFFKKAC